jgi:dephospho-CoA kinase
LSPIGPLNHAAVVVGLTGPNASGKGEVARFLSEQGFGVHSLSDVVREEASTLGLEHTRDNLIAVGVRLRERDGPGVLAGRILPRLGERSVVDSIRGPAEVEVLRAHTRFVLLGIEAPIGIRFHRSLVRGRIGDGETLEEFRLKEERENSATQTGQQLRRTFDLADQVVCNDGSLELLRQRTRDVLAVLGITI